MIHYKSEEEIDLVRESSLLVAKTHAEIASLIKPGISTLELDNIAEEFIRDNGGKPAFKGYNGFPCTLCASPNEVVVHGIPDKKPIFEGSILSIDCGVLMNGFYGDSAYTYEVGEVDEETKKLLRVTKESLYEGIKCAVAGKRMGDIGSSIQKHAEENNFGVVREMIGHGIGRSLHENPEVPNYGKQGSGIKLKKGLVIAIEPMINMGLRGIVQQSDGWTITTEGSGIKLKKGLVIAIEPMINMGLRGIVQQSDGWTITTVDKKPSAHFEHTIVVREGAAEILSSFKEIEKILNKNG